MLRFLLALLLTLIAAPTFALESAPVVINRLFDGSHRGKLLLRVNVDA